MQFHGDIIITDPCYIMNHDNNDKTTCPGFWDFVSKSYLQENGCYYNPKPEDYPDARPKTLEDYILESKSESMGTALMKLDKILGKKPMFSDTLAAEWLAYEKASEIYEQQAHSDWDKCDCGSNMKALGFTTYIVSHTGYGDWSCHVFEDKTNKTLGQFCADAAMVGVFRLEDVLRYNPNFNYHIEKPWTTTLIENFHGEIEILQSEEGIYVKGTGNINFYSQQTGL